MRQITTRSRLIVGSATTAVSLSVIQAPARPADFVYKLGHPNPLDYPTAVRIAQMVDAIKQDSRGRLEIQIFPNGILGSNAAMLEQLRLGSIQFTEVANADYGAIVPAAQIDAIDGVFTSREQAFDTLDGPLGAYVRQQFLAKGIYAFEKANGLGFRQVITSMRPIRSVDDCAGLKLRCSPVPISVEFWKALGASPTYVTNADIYAALQTHLIDGMETPASTIEVFKQYEVTKYLSLTNHVFNGAWFTANADAMKALPRDLQAIVNRNVNKYTLLTRADITALDTAAVDRLKGRGMIVNTVDTASIRARLGPYFARWKAEFGNTMWSLLEAKVGKLG